MSRELAELVFKYETGGWDATRPEGFEYLGSGISRSVYRGPDGNVYKFGHARTNESEATFSNWLRINRPMPGVIWPTYEIHDFDSINTVSESQYFQEDETIPVYECDRNSSRRRWFIQWLYRNGITDCHGGNVWSYKSHMVCIDMGFVNMVGAARECFEGTDKISNWDKGYDDEFC